MLHPNYGLALMALLAAAGLLAPESAARREPFQSPSWTNPLGTDDAGHDVLASVLRGGRTSLLVGFTVGIAAATLGTVAGAAAGFIPALDAPLMRLVDLFLVIPRLPLVIFLSLFLRPSVWNVIALLSLLSWPVTARAVRPLVRNLSQAEFVLAARTLGAGRWYVLTRHIVPHLYGVFAAQCIVEARHGVIAESGLGFLGLEDPTIKSWGIMLAYAFNHQATFVSGVWKWTVLPPAIALTLFILALGITAAGLEGLFNPRLRQAQSSAGITQ